MQQISVHYFCILQLYWIHWLALVVFWWHLWDFLCIVSCHLQTVTVLLLLFHLEFILLLFILWLPWLGCPKLCFIIALRVDILVLFSILEEMLSGFHHWEWCLLWVYHIWPLIYWCRFPLCPLYGEFDHKWVLNFVKSFFCIYWYYHMDFIF